MSIYAPTTLVHVQLSVGMRLTLGLSHKKRKLFDEYVSVFPIQSQ